MSLSAGNPGVGGTFSWRSFVKAALYALKIAINKKWKQEIDMKIKECKGGTYCENIVNKTFTSCFAFSRMELVARCKRSG